VRKKRRQRQLLQAYVLHEEYKTCCVVCSTKPLQYRKTQQPNKCLVRHFLSPSSGTHSFQKWTCCHSMVQSRVTNKTINFLSKG